MVYGSLKKVLVGGSVALLILILPACQQARVTTPVTEPTYSFVRAEHDTQRAVLAEAPGDGSPRLAHAGE